MGAVGRILAAASSHNHGLRVTQSAHEESMKNKFLALSILIWILPSRAFATDDAEIALNHALLVHSRFAALKMRCKEDVPFMPRVKIVEAASALSYASPQALAHAIETDANAEYERLGPSPCDKEALAVSEHLLDRAITSLRKVAEGQ